MEQIEIEFTYNKQLLIEAYRLALRRNSFFGKKWVIWFIVAVVLLWAIWYVPVDPRYWKGLGFIDFQFPVMFVLFFAIFYWAYWYRIPNRMANKILKYPESQSKTKWIITEAKINIVTLNTNSEVQWSYFQKAFFNKKYILLYSNRSMSVLPVDVFKANELELFKGWIRKNIKGVKE